MSAGWQLPGPPGTDGSVRQQMRPSSHAPCTPPLQAQPSAGAGRGRAVRLGSAGARPTRDFLPVLTADQPGIAVPLDTAGAITALAGARWRRALVLGLTRPGPTGNRHAVLAADQPSIAGAEHAAVAVASLAGAGRRGAFRLWLAGTRATGDRLSTLTADQSRVTVALHSTSARAPLASARRIAFRLGLAGTGSTWRAGRAAADQAGVTGRLGSGRAVAAFAVQGGAGASAHCPLSLQ